MNDHSQDHIHINAVASEGQGQALHLEVVPLSSCTEDGALPISRLGILDNSNVLIADWVSETRVYGIEIAARQLAPHHALIFRSKETIPESKWVPLDLDQEQMGQQVWDSSWIDVLAAWEPASGRMDRTPVVIEVPQLGMPPLSRLLIAR